MSYQYRFIPGNDPTLLLLHGTGGDEHDLVPLAQELLPGAAILSPRGNVLENGNPRFFRRLEQGVFDEADLIARTNELADFVIASAQTYNFNKNNVIALGFSNGANIAASMLLLRPDVLAGAILLRPMLPLVPSARPDLNGKRVLMLCGKNDPLIPPGSAERLAELLREAGAEADYQIIPSGHGLTQADIEVARRWLAGYSSLL
jgi:phospholipase/carboxylesterase